MGFAKEKQINPMWPVFIQEKYGRVFTIRGQEEGKPQAANQEARDGMEVAMGEETAKTESEPLREVEESTTTQVETLTDW